MKLTPVEKAKRIVNVSALAVMVLTILALVPIFFVRLEFVFVYVLVCFVFLTVLVKKLSDRVFEVLRNLIA